MEDNGLLVLRLSPGAPALLPRSQKDLSDLLEDLTGIQLWPWRNPNGDARLVYSVEPDRLEQLEDCGGESFADFMALSVPDSEWNRAGALLQELRRPGSPTTSWFTEAYLERVRPPVNPAAGSAQETDGEADSLAAAAACLKVPTQVNVAAAALHPGANGAAGRLRFIDIESGWFLKHNGLAQLSFDVEDGVNDARSQTHGTAAMGLAVGSGGFGIAPRVPSVGWVSVNRSPSTRGGSPQRNNTDAIMFALSRLSPGDVLLIELEQFGGLPAEVLLAQNMAIRVGVRCGVTVVVPAGNRGVHLDGFQFPAGSIDPTRNDTGSIMVSGGVWDDTQQQWRASSFCNTGTRIDCFAPAQRLVSLGWHDRSVPHAEPPPEEQLNCVFSLTSAASAAIAGAAVSMQGIARHRGKWIPCETLRKYLSDPENGTTSKDAIGVMPDLGKVATRVLADMDTFEDVTTTPGIS